MKIPYKIISIAFISTFIFGCSSTSVQHIAKPDMSQPISENETIIQLKRADHFQASLNNAFVVANDKAIGELANNEELVWKTNSNSLECISLEHERAFLEIKITLDNTPVSYKCFETKPKSKLTLIYDFSYPEMVFAGNSFTPIFKLSPTFDSQDKVTVNVINSALTEIPREVNIKTSLENVIKKKFGANLDASSNRNIDIEILQYKTGNAAKRWLVQSMDGSTFIKVKVTIREDEEVVETFITRPVVSDGGFLSAGADEYILNDVAYDIYLHLFGKSS